VAQKEVFSSRWALILAALGMAIGTGNIWRFPRIVAQNGGENGGGAFLIAWLIFLFLWSIPLLIVEFAMGKHSRKGTIGAFKTISNGKYTWMGGFVGFCTMGIMFYYSVVTGWCIKYFIAALSGQFGENFNYNMAKETFSSFTTSMDPLFFHFLAMITVSVIIYRGVVNGIEKVNKIIIPSLLLILIIAGIRALMLPDALKGIEFLFTIDFAKFADYRLWLEALTQSAWSTGAGWGLILTYAVYMKKREDIVLNSFIAGLGNNSASLLAGIVIFATVFSLGSGNVQDIIGSESSNNGLAFEWMPALFATMPGGRLFGALFFLGLSFAAISSLIAMVELSVRIFMDFGMSRRITIILVGTVGFIMGIPSALSMNVFNNQDWVWGVGLMVSGGFFSFVVIRYGVDKFRANLINTEGNDISAGRWFEIIIAYLIPIEFIVMVCWWFYQSTSWEANWWNPIGLQLNIGTCIFQWGILIGLFLFLNSLINKKIVEET